MTTLNKSTGPKTDQGKARSSKNAQKSAIFSQGYLPWEDSATKQQEFNELCQYWGAKDPMRQLLVKNIWQASLCAERMAVAQRQRIEGLMQSERIKKFFAQEAGLSLLTAEQIPMWYFALDDEGNKEYALYLARVQSQALELKAHYSDTLVPHIEQRFPDLYDYVMQGQVVNASFLMVLGQRYKQSTPTLNLGAVINHISERYPHHVDWALQANRFQIIIDGLRGEQVLVGMDLEKSTRYATTFQNQIIKGGQNLMALDVHERQKQQFDRLEAQSAAVVSDSQALVLSTTVPNPVPAVIQEVVELSAQELDGDGAE